MFRGDVKASFSDSWYRVAETTPRLSPHAVVTRQQFGPEIAFVVEDPAGGHYYRLTPAAYFFAGLLDGKRTCDRAWRAACAQLGDGAPTQRECIDLISKLQSFGLIIGAEPIAPEMLSERVRRARTQRRQRRFGKWVFLNVPLWNPERFLDRYRHLFGPLFGRTFAVLWLGLIVLAGVLVARNARALGGELNSLLDPKAWVLMTLVFLAIRAIHEMGHAMAVKAMGGRCTEIGLIMIALVLPLPYCDASSAWRFTETWRRVLVSAAGMLFEFFFAAVAAIVWVATLDNPGTAVHALAYQVMIISSITTFVFNLNPLLRYDGYYILSDVTGIPNLAQRARELWFYLIERFAFGLRGLSPPAIRGRGELWIMLVYGVLAPPYRIFIGLSIVLIVASQYLTLGLVLAAVIFTVMFIAPLFKAGGYLLGSPKLMGRRGRAIGVCSATLALLLGAIGMIPFPSGSYAWGVVEPVTRGVVRAPEDGFIARVHAQRGDALRAGDPVLELDNPLLRRDLKVTRAQLERAMVERDRAMLEEPGQVDAAERRIGSLTKQVARLEERVASLIVRAPVTGRLVVGGAAGEELASLEGRFIEKGALLAMVASTEDLVVHASISDRERAYVFRAGDEEIGSVAASMRVRGRAGEVIRARAVSMAPVATRRLEERSLSTDAGGDLVLDPTDPNRSRTLVPHAVVRVHPQGEVAGLQPGQRVRVRFAGPEAPLASQLWRRASQFLSTRFSL